MRIGTLQSRDHAELEVLLKLWNDGLLRDMVRADAVGFRG